MKKLLPIILIILLTLPAARFLFSPGYFSMHDDLQVMRIFQIEKCLADGQIPCRWVPDMAYGYGQAMFNFYSAFPYYLGALIRIVTPLSIIGTVKLLFLLSLVAAAVGMYLLAREFWGKTGGILAAVLYTYAPYHALDIFVRGALAESFALAILPFLWLGFYLLIKKPTFARLAGVTFSLAALFTTHNLSSLIYAPFTIVWVAFWIIRFKSGRSIKNVALAGILGFGLASFFILPVIFESSLIQTRFLTLDYLNYEAHFVAVRQLFLDRDWGFGPSIFGPEDELSFAIGWPHWLLGIFLALIAILWLRKRKRLELPLLLFGLLGAAGFTAYLTHLRSIPIWKAIPIMSIVQFPWRFLGLTIFFLSFALGAFAKGVFRFSKVFSYLIIVFAITLNVGYFKPEYNFPEETDDKKLSGESFLIQQKSAILDYLPKTTPDAPKEPAPNNPVIVSGDGRAYNFSKRSNSFFFDAEIYQDAQLQIPVMHFPGWKVVSGGNVIPSGPMGDYGLITISLPQGKHIIQGRFENTPVRSLGNAMTVTSALVIFGGFLLKANKRKFLWL